VRVLHGPTGTLLGPSGYRQRRLLYCAHAARLPLARDGKVLRPKDEDDVETALDPLDINDHSQPHAGMLHQVHRILPIHAVVNVDTDSPHLALELRPSRRRFLEVAVLLVEGFATLGFNIERPPDSIVRVGNIMDPREVTSPG
jgi:hypothetical protein